MERKYTSSIAILRPPSYQRALQHQILAGERPPAAMSQACGNPSSSKEHLRHHTVSGCYSHRSPARRHTPHLQCRPSCRRCTSEHTSFVADLPVTTPATSNGEIRHRARGRLHRMAERRLAPGRSSNLRHSQLTPAAPLAGARPNLRSRTPTTPLSKLALRHTSVRCLFERGEDQRWKGMELRQNRRSGRADRDLGRIRQIPKLKLENLRRTSLGWLKLRIE